MCHSLSQVGCANRSCRKTYHVSCGLKHGALMQFCDEFSSFCSSHRPSQEANETPEEASCGVCLDDIRPKDEGVDAMWAPCCKGW